MKQKLLFTLRPSTRAAATGLFLAFSMSASAAHYWDGVANGSWATAGNWSTDAAGTTDPGAAPGISDDVFFNITSQNSTNLVLHLNGVAQAAKSLTFNSTGTIEINNVATPAATPLTNLSLGNGGLTVAVGAGAVRIGGDQAVGTNGATLLLTDSTTFTHNGSSSLTIGRAITTATSLGARTLTLTGTGIVENAGITQASGTNLTVQVTGGTHYFRQNNSTITGLTINGGTVHSRASNQFGIAASPPIAAFTWQSGTFAAVVSNRTYTNAISLTGSNFTLGVGDVAAVGNILTYSGSTATFSGAVNLNAGNRTITTAGTSTQTMSGVFSNGNFTLGAGSTAVLVLSNTANAQTNTTVSGGILNVTNAGALPGYNAAGRVSVANGATLRVTAGGAGQWVSSELDSLLGATTAAFSSGSILGIDVGTGNTFTYANDIGATQAAKGLAKVGAGTLVLTNANTHTGGTTLAGGRINFGNNTSFGTNTLSVTGNSSLGATTAALTVANAIDVASGVNLDFRNGGVVTNTTFSGVLSGTGTIRSIQNGEASPVFSNAANTFTGNVNIAGNTMSFASLGDGGTTSLGGSNVGTFIWTGGDATFSTRAFRTATSNANGFVLQNNNSASTITINTNFVAEQTVNTALNLGGSGKGVFAGTIGNSTATGTPTTGITKNDGGTWTLGGANTYTGATNVNAGTLLINGSTSTTSVVTVASGATLGGTSGTVGGATTVNGFLAPGSSIGTLNFSTSLALGATSTYLFELNSTANTADLTNLGAGATLSINTASILDLVQLGTYGLGDKFTLFSYSSTLTGTFSGLADLATFTDAGGLWQINYADTTAGLNGGTGSSFVTITAIPEPRAALLGGLGMLLLLKRRRA